MLESQWGHIVPVTAGVPVLIFGMPITPILGSIVESKNMLAATMNAKWRNFSKVMVTV